MKTNIIKPLYTVSAHWRKGLGLTLTFLLITASCFAQGGVGFGGNSGGGGNVTSLTMDTCSRNITAVSGHHYLYDCTSGNKTATLPLALANGKPIQFTVVNGTNSLTINCAGSDHFNYASGATSKSKVLKDSWIRLTPKAGIWVIEEGNSLSQLGTVFQGIPDTTTNNITTAISLTFSTATSIHRQDTISGNLTVSVALNANAKPGYTKTYILIGSGNSRVVSSWGNIKKASGSGEYDDTAGIINVLMFRLLTNGIVERTIYYLQ